MVLVAMLIMVFFIFTALAIDTASFAASAEQARFAAKYAALQALETYVSTEGSKQQRLDAALNAANASGTLNLVLAATSGPGSFQVADTEEQVGTLTHPVLLAGRFYAAENPTKDMDGSSCTGNDSVCGAGKSPPCFVPLDDINPNCDTLSSGDPNSFQIVGPYYSGIRKWFAGAFSPGTASIQVDEVAAVVPRHTCFLVDISTSMAQETHFGDAVAPNEDERSILAYFVSTDNPGVNKTTNASDLHDDGLWNVLLPSRSGALAPPSPTATKYKRIHYKDDYSDPIAVLNDGDYGSDTDYAKHHPDPNVINPETGINYSMGTDPKKFRVDTRYFKNPQQFAGTSYDGGPEPFTTVFRALNTLVAKFKERSVVGDQVCLIFFDSKLEWSRIINLTSDFDYVTKFTDLSLQGPDEGWSLLFKHQIFPIRLRDSNLQMAVSEALNQFSAAQQSSIPSLDQMVVFGDGITNCTSCTGASDPKCTGTGFGAGPGCRDIYQFYLQSVSELHKFAATQLFPRRIRLDFFLMGSHVLPNYRLLSKADDQGALSCMTDAEARQAKADYVDGGSYPYTSSADKTSTRQLYKDKSEAAPFLQPNKDMYQIVRLLGGSWVPIMEYDSEIDTDGNGQCAPSCGANPETRSTTCRTPTQQVDDAINEIMGSNPYMIVKH